MPLLMATSTFGLERRFWSSWHCYLDNFHGRLLSLCHTPSLYCTGRLNIYMVCWTVILAPSMGSWHFNPPKLSTAKTVVPLVQLSVWFIGRLDWLWTVTSLTYLFCVVVYDCIRSVPAHSRRHARQHRSYRLIIVNPLPWLDGCWPNLFHSHCWSYRI